MCVPVSSPHGTGDVTRRLQSASVSKIVLQSGLVSEERERERVFLLVVPGSPVLWQVCIASLWSGRSM